MTFDPHAYTIRVRKIAESGQVSFEATVAELPYVSGHGKSVNAAYADAIDIIDALYKGTIEDGQPFPAPVSAEEDVSGRVTLRMSKSLHRAVIAAAGTEGVSLNSYICEVLTQRIYSPTTTAVAPSPTPIPIQRISAGAISTGIAGISLRGGQFTQAAHFMQSGSTLMAYPAGLGFTVTEIPGALRLADSDATGVRRSVSEFEDNQLERRRA